MNCSLAKHERGISHVLRTWPLWQYGPTLHNHMYKYMAHNHMYKYMAQSQQLLIDCLSLQTVCK